MCYLNAINFYLVPQLDHKSSSQTTWNLFLLSLLFDFHQNQRNHPKIIIYYNQLSLFNKYYDSLPQVDRLLNQLHRHQPLQPVCIHNDVLNRQSLVPYHPAVMLVEFHQNQRMILIRVKFNLNKIPYFRFINKILPSKKNLILFANIFLTGIFSSLATGSMIV